MICADVYDIFFKPGEVTEIRAYGCQGRHKAWKGWVAGKGVVSGYFDNREDFGRAADSLEAAKAEGIYFTLNPVIPDLLARAANRLKAGKEGASTADKDIACIRWLPIDLDPVRPSGISATRDELTKAVKLRNEIYKFMMAQGFGFCVPAVSGNGAHLSYLLVDHPLTNRENPGEDPMVQLIRRAIALVAATFQNETVHIDRTVSNPARIWKLYGTTARKGDHTKDRPHRKSYIEKKWLEMWNEQNKRE